MQAETIDRIKKDSIDEAEWKRKQDSAKGKGTEPEKINEMESIFPGGSAGWKKYLMKNMEYPDKAQKLQKQGQVVLQFIVDKEGKILDPEIIQSVEFSLDQEALRIIKQSPAWVPAFQNGKKVKSYKKQPITFRLQ